jgi:nucleotide-binding universal stress UspA family protein
MKNILVALDNSLGGNAVMGNARALGLLLDAQVEALHVRTDGERTVHQVAEAADVLLRITTGPVIDALVEAGHSDDVIALALGARGSDTAHRPLGSTAAGVASALAKPVMIVPPRAEPVTSFRRVLVPIEGTVSSSLAPRAIFELAGGARVDAVALHVYDEASVPAFTDQPQHEQPAWEEEFLQRYCPWGIGEVRLETRSGRSGEVISQMAAEFECDLIALAWSQELSSGRAPVVRETLERSSRPVLLVPVRGQAEGREAMDSAGHGSRTARK